MALRVRLERREGYVYAEVKGEYSTSEACRTFSESLPLIDELGERNVVVDCLGIVGSPSTLDFYTYGTHIASELAGPDKHGRSRWMRIVYVVQGTMHDKEFLAQMVATNRGAMVKSVGSVEEALRWLEIPST